MNLFVDANVLLGFHGLTPKEVGELRKLVALMKAGELTLWLPSMVIDEYRRNRPKVVAEALRPLRESRLSVPTPSFSESMTERERLEKAITEAQKAHSSLLALLELRAAAEELPADEVIEEIIRAANVVLSDEALSRARERRELRRPPGKADSLGDAVNWETLLETVPDNEDMHIASADSDFRSLLDKDRLHEYLSDEWIDRKNGSAKLYLGLAAFLGKRFAAVQVPSDIPKLRLIQRLGTTTNFESSHDVIEKLSAYEVFTPEQAALITRNAVRNNQVRWIAADDDVRVFLTRILDAHRGAVDQEIAGILERCMNGDQRAYSKITLGEELL